MFHHGESPADLGSVAPDTNVLKRAAKRGVDIALSAFLLVLTAPLMALIALMIYLRDGDEVIYPHERIGQNGVPFPCYKFRTMVKDADIRLEALLASDPGARREWDECRKLQSDPRILQGVGHVLRSSSLDELPQLWNVLRGDMSLVGPRPVVKTELEVYYGAAAGLYASVRPGITGPWQVGDRSDGTYESRVRDDTAYVRNWTLTNDLAIILKTAGIVLRGRSPGAY
ncbi:MAG: sugar transferase [Pseudomonadota bacterium]